MEAHMMRYPIIKKGLGTVSDRAISIIICE